MKYNNNDNTMYLSQENQVKTIYEEMLLDKTINSRSVSKYIPMEPNYNEEREEEEYDINNINQLYSRNNIIKGQEENKILPIIGRLRYIADNTRPDILCALGLLSIGSNNPTEKQFKGTKFLLNYLNKNSELGIKIGGNNNIIRLMGFVDASLKHTRLGGCLYLNINIGAFDSFSTKDDTISHSSTEIEIKALDKIILKIIHFREILKELGYEQSEPTMVFIDCKSAKEICEAFMTTNKTQHINRRIKFIREQINNRVIQLIFIPTEYNIADILTKPLGSKLYNNHREKLLNGFNEEFLNYILKRTKINIYKNNNNINSIIIEDFSNNI
jgi:hypothetical protein